MTRMSASAWRPERVRERPGCSRSRCRSAASRGRASPAMLSARSWRTPAWQYHRPMADAPEPARAPAAAAGAADDAPPPMLPSRWAFLLAFAGVVLAGILGGIIGYGIADVSSHSDAAHIIGGVRGCGHRRRRRRHRRRARAARHGRVAPPEPTRLIHARPPLPSRSQPTSADPRYSGVATQVGVRGGRVSGRR